MNQLECPHGCGRTFNDNKRMEDHIKTRHFLQQKAYPSLSKNTNVNVMQRKVNVLRQKLPQLRNNLSETQSSFSTTQQQMSESVIPQQKPSKPFQKIQLQFKKNTTLRLNSYNRKIDDVQNIDDQKDKEFNDTQKTQQTIKIMEASPVISANDLMEARKMITKQFVCTNSDGSDLKSVTNLSLIDKNLLIFESTTEVPFSELNALKSLSLSQNKLINVIGISILQNIVDLNVNNNKITTLQPLGDCKRLQRLYANHNLIDSIEFGLMIHLNWRQLNY
ncbi:unnamed protein product [Paramecium octaurelia]|uniref:C2H2-type domain-containing protein n=1 Tax=Paramecium octaurelia TaxID=43137 RepID=A0A8S1TAN6_PAROT|nr:unnamed protein product [Paramecium octaurelia]